MNCSYCYLSLEEDADLCPRCGTQNEVTAPPSGGEGAQASAPTSYSPGGPTYDIGIHSTCPGCGDSMGSDGSDPRRCQHCGFSTVEHDEGWSDFVTLEDAENASIWVSKALLSEDEDTIRRLATGIVWGEFPDDADATETDMDDMGDAESSVSADV